MNKKLIAIAVAAGLAAPMAANAAPTVYGKAHVSIDSIDYDSTTNEDNLVVASNSSRLGVKGSEDLGGGLKALYKYESGIGIDEASAWSGGRNHYLGLGGDFGKVLVGKMDTPMKGLSRKVELFPEHIGDNRNIVRGGGAGWDERIDNVIAYSSPKFGNGMQLNAAYSTDHGEDGAAPRDQDDNDFSATSISLTYSNGPLFVGVATETHDLGTAGDESALRASASYTMGMHKFIGLYHTASDLDGTSGNDRDAMGLGYAMKMGKNVFKVHYFTADPEGNNNDSTLLAVGVDHKLSKKTTAYVTYAAIDNDANATAQVNGGGHGNAYTPGAGESPAGISIGMITNF